MFNTALTHLKKHDPILSRLIVSHSSPGFKAHTNYYQALVSSIVGQQLSVKAASTIEQRFLQLFDDNFPSPEQILEKDIETLRQVGLSRQKASYIQDLARRILDGQVDFSIFDSLSNEAIIAELTKVRGIGVWTVRMFLMFCMGRADILPAGDLGIRNGIQKLYGFNHLPTTTEVEEIALKNKWHPYESIAAWYIWRSLENTPNIK
jgi:DNA-3-methyladenine glycosylase II